MPPISSLVSNILADYPQYTFIKGDQFRWSPTQEALYYTQLTDMTDVWSMLHELGHAELNHTDYSADVALVQAEALAWQAAQQIAVRYDVVININYIEDHLDTYREWLHARSTCPECGQNGLQTKNTYSCINCRCLWRANEARICNLRRVTLQGQDQIS